MQKQYYVYILANKTLTLYIGFTNNLKRRCWEHKQKLIKGFTQRHNISKLIYYETFPNRWSSTQREQQLKKWNRKKKLQLITQTNPTLIDLYEQINQR